VATLWFDVVKDTIDDEFDLSINKIWISN